MSLSSPGCLPVSSTIFALPRTACAAKRYACARGIPSATAASAIASININTYAGELPLTETTTSIRRSGSISAFPQLSRIFSTSCISASDTSSLQHTPVMPSPTRAGVFGMHLTSFTFLPNCSSSHASVFPGAMEMIIFFSSTASLISWITSS